MITFKYTSFVCEIDELAGRLDELGAQGWRLHTCEPTATIGPSGSGVLRIFVVMDMATDTDMLNDDVSGSVTGITMKG